ncbi:kinesin-like protein KIF27 isoform X2 [Dendropsophus ebraccatus]|uniref:kinesin-like protein KIF27 isoform X2 n=1 Tax=Dendropsophus ebraccatus TaxID=150705 RepID=UPI003831C6AF
MYGGGGDNVITCKERIWLSAVENSSVIPSTMDEIPVKVAVRIRPLLSREILHKHQVCVRPVPNTQQIIIGKDRVFTFDHVFGKSATQDDVYSSCIKPLLVSLIEGYNATVFAYGQTGSGKTYTIGGGHVASVADEEKGIIPRAIQELFQTISEHHNIDFTVKVSYIEVYKEDLRDLLELETNVKDIHIREDEKGNTVIVGAKECQVESADEVMSLLEAGSAVRHTSTTQMNERSSRSHAIFTISICQQRDTNIGVTENGSKKPAQMIFSKFHFVDLAGSERVTKTGNTGERFKESIQINSGLLALGNVISALADPKRKNAHVPYRDAKITRILKDSLGGNAKTVMITCISPSTSDFDESLNSLKYSNRARNIKNKPIVNYNPDWDRIDEMELEIKALREALQNQQSSRVSRTSQVSQDWSQEKIKVRALEEQLAQYQLECYNHRHCTEEALELLYELKEMSGLSKSQKNRLQTWLAMAEELKSDVTAVTDAVSGSREEPHHITILQLKRELKKCQDALAADEEVFARKEVELKELKENILSLQQENQHYQKSLEEAEHSKNLQTEKLVEQQILIDELKYKVEDFLQKQSQEGPIKVQDLMSKRPHSVPLSHQLQMLSSSLRQSSDQSEPRKVRTSPPSYSLERVVAGFRTRSQMLLDLIEEQDEVSHEKFSDHSDEELEKQDKKMKTNPPKSPFRRSINRTWTRRQAPEAGTLNNETAITSVQESQSLNLKKLKSTELRLAEARQKLRELTINIKMKEELIDELAKTSNDAQSVNKQYSLKIAHLEQEAEQAKAELAEAQKQLQELENKELRDQAQKAKLQKDFRKKMEAAKSKMQVLQRKQQDTKKIANLSAQNEKCLSDLEQNIQSMRQQQLQLQKKLKEESDRKKKLELAVQKDQQQIKELQLKNEQQQKMLKLKNEEIAAIRRRKSTSSLPDQLQLKLEEQKKWLDEEVEKVLKERQALSELEEDLNKREESIAKMEAMLKEKSHLEMKKLRSSQALNSDMLKLSSRLNALENELTDKSKKLHSGNSEEQKKVSEEVKVLQKERDHLLQRRDSLDEKLKNGTVLSPEEEHILFQLEEGIEALEAAIEYKNECIQSRQQALKDSSQILTQSEANVIEKFSSLSASETRSVLIKYFNKVVNLRETERKLQIQAQELAMKVSEQENVVRELESALEHLTLQNDRRLTQQQKEHEQKMQLLLQQFKDHDRGVSAGNIMGNETKIEELERELYFYKTTSRELRKKLRDLVGEANMTFPNNGGSGEAPQNQDELAPMTSKEQKWASKIENGKPTKKPKDPTNSRFQHSTYRIVGDNTGAGDHASEPRRQVRRHFSSGDDTEDTEESQTLKPQSASVSQMTKSEAKNGPLVVNPVKLSRREVRQISIPGLSSRRSSAGSIIADSIEVTRKSSDHKF